MVLAFYYTWFDSGTWTLEGISDWPREQYRTNDPNAVRRQMDQARDAGIDAFVVSWLGPGNRTDINIKMMLAVASEKGMQVGVDFEADEYGGDPGRIADALRYVRDELVTHPFYLRHRGKPVLFFWRQQDLGVDTWRWIRDQVDPTGAQLWIAEGVDVAYQAVFDGHHLYSVAWSPNLDYTYNSWRDRIRGYSARTGLRRYWVATVMPGYNDLSTGRPDAFVRDRENGGFYRESWREARESSPDWVVITSWNEWVEGSQIEPSGTYGDLYLDITRQESAGFKTSR
ncbi:MAG: endo-1,3-alpha-glucanase family glycosylhydrolase [Anaerolineae bacterium]